MVPVQEAVKWFAAKSRGCKDARLQQLLYLAQGYHLGCYKRPLFEAGFIAAECGPVVEGAMGKDRAKDCVPGPLKGAPLAEDLRTLAIVLAQFGASSDEELEKTVKAEGSPWQKTVRGRIISPSSMAQYFEDDMMDEAEEKELAALSLEAEKGRGIVYQREDFA